MARIISRFQLARAALLLSLGSISASALGQYQATFLYRFAPPTGDAVGQISFDGQQQVGFGPAVATAVVGEVNHAVYWNANGSAVDLNPAGFTYSLAQGTFGNVQVGYGYPGNQFSTPATALMWTGSAASVVNLSPAGYQASFAYGTDGTYEVGKALQAGVAHAVMWAGSNAAVDLHPAGYDSSVAYGVGSGQQVGAAATGGNEHAALWTGSASSFVDLHPSSGFVNTIALTTSGTQQVGYGYGYYSGHDALPPASALLWTGSAGSLVNLSPAGYSSSFANATNGFTQVGTAISATLGGSHAAAWSGTAASFVDLQAFLPASIDSSIANSVDGSGNIFGWAEDSNNNTFYVVEWAPVPEPVAGSVLALGFISLYRFRRKPRVITD